MIDSESSAKAWIEALADYPDEANRKLYLLVAMLQEENLIQNLVAKATMEMVWQRHIADSGQLLRFVPRGTSRSWIDLGTGAGFPGLVIAILRPDVRLVMVESRRRRIDWLHRVVEALDLPNARVEGKRLEDVKSQPFAVISARAFAPLPQLLELASRFSTSSTTWLLPKGRSASQELSDLREWNHMFHVEQSLTDPDAGIIVGASIGQKGATA